MSDTPERLPYEPMDERERAKKMVENLRVTVDGDVFDLIARLLKDKDRLDWLGCHRWLEYSLNNDGASLDGPMFPEHDHANTLREAIDSLRRIRHET